MKRLIAIVLFCIVPMPAILLASDISRPNIIVFYTDDHGHADLGIHGVMPDLKTPNLDALARSGVVAKHGYSTAPQCVPSRGGLLVGKYQTRFELESNQSSLDGFNQEITIATRLQKSGYVTAQFGKWHLGPVTEIPKHGFKHFFSQNNQSPFPANIALDGTDRAIGNLPPTNYHIDGCSRAAASIIDRYKDDPFFLYIAYRAPHTPLDAPKVYTDRFPGQMPERRRQALAMISAIDDGVGLITSTLAKHDLTERTLIFLIGDNGAPLKVHKIDSPLNGDAGGWDGSLNDPLNGEKGMLSEGGIHVPFLVAWPGTIPEGQTYMHPVTALDVAATATEIAGVQTETGDLDGVNLVPYLKGEIDGPPHQRMYWRWLAQSAIREGKWKLLRGGNREYLYDLESDIGEKNNLAKQYPDIADRLRTQLTQWGSELTPPGIAVGSMAPTWNDYYDHYLEGKTIPKPPASEIKQKAGNGEFQGWLARGGRLELKEGNFVVEAEKGSKSPFITRSQLKLAGPLSAKLILKSTSSGQARFAWRMQNEKDFVPSNAVSFDVTASEDWKTHEVAIPADGTVIHIRLHLPPRTSQIQSLELKDDQGKTVHRFQPK
jgi:arylsulfatase A-like enzyme